MKVDNFRLGPDKVAQKYDRRIDNSAKRSKSKIDEPGALDTVKISDEAKLLSKAKASISILPDTREDKVAQIREAIASGTYKIDSHAIAEKMAEKLRADK